MFANESLQIEFCINKLLVENELTVTLGGTCSFSCDELFLKFVKKHMSIVAKERAVFTKRSSRSQMFFKKGVLKMFAIFTGKHLCWSFFLRTTFLWPPGTAFIQIYKQHVSNTSERLLTFSNVFRTVLTFWEQVLYLKADLLPSLNFL